MKTITLGGGCFWCIQYLFKHTKGVTRSVCGYGGGKEPNPTYEMICSKKTKHIELVQIDYDQKTISTEDILKGFFFMHDPT